MILLQLVVALGAFAAAAGVVAYLCGPSAPLRVVDQPMHRSLHTIPVPRTGGIGILAGIMTGIVGAGLLLPETFTAHGALITSTLAGLAIIAAVSLADDLWSLSAAARLPVHLLAAGLVVFGGGAVIREVPLGGFRLAGWEAVGVAATLLFISWLSNLYNFMDGMDGLAGTMSVVGFGTIAIIAAAAGDRLLVTLSVVTAAAAAGFLAFNRPPARIFMGDIGSVSLGFLAGSVAAAGVSRGTYDLWVPLLAFSPFIVDSGMTVIRRALRGSRIWEAHREHYYQRLVLSGWSHGRTLALESALMLLGGAAAIIYANGRPSLRPAVLLFVAAVYVALHAGVRAVARRSLSG